jgi:hypothetical protein
MLRAERRIRGQRQLTTTPGSSDIRLRRRARFDSLVADLPEPCQPLEDPRRDLSAPPGSAGPGAIRAHGRSLRGTLSLAVAERPGVARAPQPRVFKTKSGSRCSWRRATARRGVDETLDLSRRDIASLMRLALRLVHPALLERGLDRVALPDQVVPPPNSARRWAWRVNGSGAPGTG